MKKVLISLGLAMVLVVAMTAPVMAVEGTETASVTVNAYISATITDAGAAGISFGSLDPGVSDQKETDQNGAGAINITVELETNAATKISTKGTDFAITLATGSATNGTPSATVLDDSGADFVTAGVSVGDTVINTTDGSSGTVDTGGVAATSLTLSAGLSGGSDNTFTSGDSYVVKAASPSETIVIGNAKWDSDSDVNGATAMTTSYNQIGSDTTPGVQRIQEVWHWISIDAGQAPGIYHGYFYYKADTTL